MVRATRPARFTLLLLAASLLPASLHAAPHRGTRTMRSQIVAIEQQWRQAALADDTKVMDHLLSENYLGIMANGEVVTKFQELNRMKSGDFSISKLDVSDTRIKLLSRHAAIVTSLAQVEANYNGHPIDGSFRYTRVYQRPSTGAWKITSFEATRVRRHGHLISTADNMHS